MGKFDEKTEANPMRKVVMILLFMLLFSVAIEIFQNGVLRSLQKDIDRLELIAEDYCNTTLSKQEFCDSILNDVSDENELLIVKP